MTNRAFIPTVCSACRAQCTTSSSAAKQQKEAEKEKAPPRHPHPNCPSFGILSGNNWHEKGNLLHHRWNFTVDSQGRGGKVLFLSHVSD